MQNKNMADLKITYYRQKRKEGKKKGNSSRNYQKYFLIHDHYIGSLQFLYL